VEIDLFEEVYRLTRQIPRGRISTYGAVAKALGDIKASRAVGFALNQNPDPDFTPCYRVVNSDGTLGGFSSGIVEKIRRLEDDGIKVIDGIIVNFDDLFFDDFTTRYPLKELRREQMELSKRIKIEDDFSDLATVGGM
jgi:deoxyribonuclease V